MRPRDGFVRSAEGVGVAVPRGIVWAIAAIASRLTGRQRAAWAVCAYSQRRVQATLLRRSASFAAARNSWHHTKDGTGTCARSTVPSSDGVAAVSLIEVTPSLRAPGQARPTCQVSRRSPALCGAQARGSLSLDSEESAGNARNPQDAPAHRSGPSPSPPAAPGTRTKLLSRYRYSPTTHRPCGGSRGTPRWPVAPRDDIPRHRGPLSA